MIILQLMYEFMKIGLFSFGGGLATLPFLQELGQRTGWFTAAQLADMLAVSESTPGAIGANMATYIGYTTAGIGGAVVATVSLIIPGAILTFVVVKLLSRFRESRLVSSAFYGLRPASVALIAVACFEVLKLSLMDTSAITDVSGLFAAFELKAVILAAILFPLIQRTKVHPIVYLAGSAVVGVIFKF